MRASIWGVSLLICGLNISIAQAQSRPTIHMPKAKPSTARLVEDVPSPDVNLTHAYVRMKASDTPSGYTVPRYVSLKYAASNGRTGPSRSHPVAWRYTRKGLPMIVVAETELWRKVRDINGDESWMDRRLLDGTHTVLARTELVLRAKAQSDSAKRALVSKGALLVLDGCFNSGWCRVRDQKGRITGYAPQSLLWGAEPL
ncbi:MAG TPA: hypothetical protein ENJ46_00935 [Hellea balneolensis]|uniref:SH3 domain-containing protein n=1 Tax=Hellea balneolensis TaxID=287478 RepID=A0A7C3C8B0_9PROT|nr:hypothetical protein [Hellea balneolensis]